MEIINPQKDPNQIRKSGVSPIAIARASSPMILELCLSLYLQGEQSCNLPSAEGTEVEGAARGLFYSWR